MDAKLKRLQNIFREIIDDESIEISDRTRRSDIPAWDSVAMIQIILAVESEFGVKFTTSEVAGITGVSDIIKKISQ